MQTSPPQRVASVSDLAAGSAAPSQGGNQRSAGGDGGGTGQPGGGERGGLRTGGHRPELEGLPEAGGGRCPDWEEH